jgi:phospholipid-translocating ATPase
VQYELPNKDLYKFEGNICLGDAGSPTSVSNDNILLRGMALRNTECIYGLVVYTGRETKI